jgi:hypothetical protein
LRARTSRVKNSAEAMLRRPSTTIPGGMARGGGPPPRTSQDTPGPLAPWDPAARAVAVAALAPSVDRALARPRTSTLTLVGMGTPFGTKAPGR